MERIFFYAYGVFYLPQGAVEIYKENYKPYAHISYVDYKKSPQNIVTPHKAYF